MRKSLLALLFLVPSAAFAQFEEKLDVNYIEVPVTVIGRDNAPVRNLTKANFEVIEAGQKRTIESFDAIDFAMPEVTRTVSPLNPASRRNFLLLFDLSFSSPVSIGRAQDAARNFVARSVGKRDLVGVATIDVDRGFRFLTSFTTDRNLLAAAIGDPRNFRAVDPLQIAGSIGAALFDTGAQGDINARNEARVSTDIAAEHVADVKRGIQAADDAYRRGRVQKQIATLSNIAHSLQKLVGRKHVVLMSEGFDPRLVSGRSAADMAEQQEENSAITSGEVWKVDSDKRFGNAAAQHSIQLMSDEFKRADVVLHAVDILGVRLQNDVRAGQRANLNDGLFLIAGATGGEVFRNSNDLTNDFDRLLRQQEVVYVLGFRAPVAKPGQFRDVKVRLVNVPSARVSHRPGYYAKGAESGIERSLSTAEIILNDLSSNDIDVAALAAAFPTTSGNESQVPVILEISGADLVKAAKGNQATTDIFVYAFDDDGIVRDSLHQRMTLDTAQAGDKLRASGVKYYGTLHLPPGRYAVKTLVRVGESDSKAYRRVDVHVPEGGDVSVLQPFFFAEAGEWVMVKGDSRQKPNAPYPFVLNGQSFIPAARATLRSGEPRQFTVWVLNAKPDELTWEIAPAAKLVSETEGMTMSKFVFEIAQVPAGTRELGVTIRKKGSADERRVTVPVSVR